MYLVIKADVLYKFPHFQPRSFCGDNGQPSDFQPGESYPSDAIVHPQAPQKTGAELLEAYILKPHPFYAPSIQ